LNDNRIGIHAKKYYALFIFIIKYFLIFYYRYVQIVFIKEYYCSNKEVQNPESNYWIGDDGKNI
jgi:hypothetical protein